MRASSNERTTSPVWSFELSSTTISSKSRHVWARALRLACPWVGARVYVGTTTLTRGGSARSSLIGPPALAGEQAIDGLDCGRAVAVWIRARSHRRVRAGVAQKPRCFGDDVG